jgi:energy-coupling factor transporter ATP-binding protein EcfA2
MRITSIDLSCADLHGLKPSRMGPLDGLVVLAGPNGAGKSRILNHVQGLIASRGPTAPEAQNSGSKRAYERALRLWESVSITGMHTQTCVHRFTPLNFELKDSRSLSRSNWTDAAKSLETLGVDSLAEGTLAYIERVLQRWLYTTHPHFNADPGACAIATESKERLASLIQDIMGTDLGFDSQLHPTLFERPIPEARLSLGQNGLLQMAVALHAQETRLDGMVLLLDEPECHLHPVATIELIERLRKANPSGQLWIATHSVPVLAAMPPDSIWFVKDGSVSWAGRRPEIVLEGLLGGPHGREKVEEFVRLPAQLAATRFAAECLLPPKVLDTPTDDPQAKQLREFCRPKAEGTEPPLRILDFGAGNGRLLHALEQRWDGPGSFTASIDYHAYDTMSVGSAKDTLEQRLLAIYGHTSTQRTFHSSVQLKRRLLGSVDIVVICNVLHEIPNGAWPSLFGAKGLVTEICKPDGVVLILEDMEIPHGEKAHQFGFLLLDQFHLSTLLGVTEVDRQITTADTRNGRLLAHVIPAACLGRVNGKTTRAALRALRTTAREKVSVIRTMEPDSQTGRLHALWTQLFANADLALHRK